MVSPPEPTPKMLLTEMDYRAAMVRLEQVSPTAKPGTPEGEEYQLLDAAISDWERRDRRVEGHSPETLAAMGSKERTALQQAKEDQPCLAEAALSPSPLAPAMIPAMERVRAFPTTSGPASEKSPEWTHSVNDQEVHRLSGPGIRIFLNIARAWGLSVAEQCQLLGDIDVATLHGWEAAQDGTLNPAQLERVSLVIGIYKSLQILLPSSADGWVRRPNTNALFQGQAAIRLMTQGGIGGLREVRNHLLALEEGWA